MSEASINASLKKLRESLEQADNIDEETLVLAQTLEADIQKALNAEKGEIETDSPADLAMELETRFESSHPLVAGLLREIVNTLHKIGV